MWNLLRALVKDHPHTTWQNVGLHVVVACLQVETSDLLPHRTDVDWKTLLGPQNLVRPTLVAETSKLSQLQSRI